MIRKTLDRLSLPPGVIPWRRVLDRRHPEFRHHWYALLAVPVDKSLALFRSLYLAQYLSWYLWNAWIHSYRGFRYLKRRRQDNANPAKWRHVIDLTILLWLYTIPLPWIVKYRLLDEPDSWLSHIYPHEIPKWQYALSGKISKHEQRFLGDKRYFAEACSEGEIPCITTLRYILRDSDGTKLQEILSQGQNIFFKPSNASRSQGCYILDMIATGYTLKELGRETTITGMSKIRQELQQANETYDFVVQPYLRNINVWRDISASTELITLRVITERYNNKCTILAAVIEIPIEDGGRFYDIIPIEPLSGRVHDGLFGHKYREPNNRQQALLAKLAEVRIPYWDDLISTVHRAHAFCPNVRTVGWDLAITDDGPILIEGNFGWDTMTMTKNPLGVALWQLSI